MTTKKRKGNGHGGFTYRSYSFVDKDPVIDRIRTVMQKEGLSYAEAHLISGVSASTMRNWLEGETRRPQYATIAALIRACGYREKFVKARTVDYEREMQKARDEIAAKVPK